MDGPWTVRGLSTDWPWTVHISRKDRRFVFPLRFCWHEFSSPWTLGELSQMTISGTKECTQLVLCTLLGCDSYGNNVFVNYLVFGNGMNIGIEDRAQSFKKHAYLANKEYGRGRPEGLQPGTRE